MCAEMEIGCAKWLEILSLLRKTLGSITNMEQQSETLEWLECSSRAYLVFMKPWVSLASTK